MTIPLVRRFGRTYRVVIRILGFAVLLGAFFVREFPKNERDEIGVILLFAASLYCHSIMFAFGNLDIPEVFPDESE